MNTPITFTEQEFISHFSRNKVPADMRSKVQNGTLETRPSYQLGFPNGHKALIFCDDLQAVNPVYDMYTDDEYIPRLNYVAVQAQLGRISRKSQFREAFKRSLVLRILVITLLASVLLTVTGWLFLLSMPQGLEISRQLVAKIGWPFAIFNTLLGAGIWYKTRTVEDNE